MDREKPDACGICEREGGPFMRMVRLGSQPVCYDCGVPTVRMAAPTLIESLRARVQARRRSR